MADSLLANKRVLITQADVFMGPALCGVFAAHGATVIASTASLVGPDAPAAVVAAAGDIDVLIANLAIPAPATPALDVTEDEWREVFATLVDPLPRLCRAVLPAMIARRAGKIVVMGSASALRGMKRFPTPRVLAALEARLLRGPVRASVAAASFSAWARSLSVAAFCSALPFAFVARVPSSSHCSTSARSLAAGAPIAR